MNGGPGAPLPPARALPAWSMEGCNALGADSRSVANHDVCIHACTPCTLSSTSTIETLSCGRMSQIIADVAQQTSTARQRAAQLRAVKKMELEQKRAQLKADFLRKQAEAVKAARQRHRKTETAAPDSTHGGEE